MTGIAFALVIGSAFLHASWNFLLKRSDDKLAFLWALCLVGFAVIGIPAAVVGAIHGVGWTGLAYGLATAVVHGAYCLALARGYQLGDLSKVYPIARGMGPALIPIAAVLLLGENVSALAVAGIVLVAVGIYAVHLESGDLADLSTLLRAFRRPETLMALLTGGLIATYSVIDKAALDHLSPVTLNGFAMGGNFLVLTPVALHFGGRATLRNEWALHRRAAIAGGIMAPLGYLMVLAALTTSRISYVAPAREIGIVIGAAMGVILLREGFGPSRIAGAVLIVAGVITLALAP